MSWWLRTLSTSVGKKFVMGITGLLLCGFLVAHLAGNLLLYVGPDAYNHYAHALHERELLVKIAEVGLLLLFLLHVLLAIATTRENRSARGVRYEQTASKLDSAAFGLRADTWMFVSGAVVLGFLVLHLSDFTFQIRLQGSPDEEPFAKAVRLLNDNLTFWVYLAGCVLLGFHLGHGVSSAFQSLGINHPRYNGLIRKAGLLFAVVMAVGFASFPVWAKMLVGTR